MIEEKEVVIVISWAEIREMGGSFVILFKLSPYNSNNKLSVLFYTKAT